MSTTTEAAPPIPEATTATCRLCGRTAHRTAMTYDGLDWYCGSESQDPAGKAAYVAAVTACTERWLSAGLPQPEPADAAAPHEWQAAAGQAPGGAELAQEAAGDAAGKDAAPEADGEAETAPEADDEPAEGVNS